MDIKITKDTRKDNGWIHLEFMGGYKVTAKVYDEPSGYGVNGGRVSKILIETSGGTVLYVYDRGEDINHIEKTILDHILAWLEDLSITTGHEQ